MSSETNASEAYENGQQREEEALAVITETSVQEGADDNKESVAEDQSKENDEHHDQDTQQQTDQQQPPPSQHEQQPQQQTSEDNAETQEKSKQMSEHEEDPDKPRLTDDKHHENDIKSDNAISVGTSTVLVDTQEVVTSSTMNSQQQRKYSTGRARSAARRASYQTSRSYAGNSFQNYGLTYLPYKSNFEPSEDARRRADEFFKTLRL
jgi:hypothetical protein